MPAEPPPYTRGRPAAARALPSAGDGDARTRCTEVSRMQGGRACARTPGGVLVGGLLSEGGCAVDCDGAGGRGLHGHGLDNVGCRGGTAPSRRRAAAVFISLEAPEHGGGGMYMCVGQPETSCSPGVLACACLQDQKLSRKGITRALQYSAIQGVYIHFESPRVRSNRNAQFNRACIRVTNWPSIPPNVPARLLQYC